MNVLSGRTLIVVIGFDVWLVTTYAPLPEPFRTVWAVMMLVLLMRVVRLLILGGGPALPR